MSSEIHAKYRRIRSAEEAAQLLGVDASRPNHLSDASLNAAISNVAASSSYFRKYRENGADEFRSQYGLPLDVAYELEQLYLQNKKQISHLELARNNSWDHLFVARELSKRDKQGDSWNLYGAAVEAVSQCSVTPEEYKAKWGFPPETGLALHGLMFEELS